MMHTNFLAVLVAGIVATGLGFLWYGPWFGRSWRQMIGFTPEKMAAAKQNGMTTAYIVNFVAALVMAFVFSLSIAARPFVSIQGGLILAFWIWLGFIATVLLGSVLWERKPMRLYWLNSLYYLVSLFLMSIVLVSWR